MPDSGSSSEGWRQTRRFVLALFVAYAVLIQALASPFLRAQAAELARIDGALAVICLSDGTPGGEDPGRRDIPHGHGLDCCLPALRLLTFDAPALAASPFTFELPAEAASLRAEYALPPSRAPPAALTTVLQPRAPPASIT